MEWSELIEATEKSDWPSAKKQEFVKIGLTYLQDFFRERVLKLALQCYHPYFTETYNLAPWNLQRYGEFGHRLRALSSVPNASQRFKQLGKAARAGTAHESIEMFFGFFNEVEIAYPLVRQGIATEFFTETSTPTPDVRVMIDRRWLNIEITNLRDPPSYWDAGKFRERLRDIVVENFSAEPYFLQIGIGRLWDDIKDSQEEVISEIVEGIRDLLSSSPTDDQISLKGIQIQIYKTDSGFSMAPPEGPQWIISYPQKIKNSIIDKAEQLQLHGPGVIVICDRVFDFPELHKYLPSMRQFIEHLIMPMPHISGVMLVFDEIDMWGFRQWSIERSDLLFAQYVLCDDTRLLSKLLVPNPSAKELLIPAERDALLAYPDMNEGNLA